MCSKYLQSNFEVPGPCGWLGWGFSFTVILLSVNYKASGPKPSQKIRTFGSILRNIIFRNKTFFSRHKAEAFSICLKLNFVKPHKISTHSTYSDNCYFHFSYQLSDWVEILWGFTKFFYKQILILDFYLEKHKGFIPKKEFFKQLSISKQKILFTDPIFSEGFDPDNHQNPQNGIFPINRPNQSSPSNK